MQIQQPNIGSFAKADYKFLQQMSDNDDLIKTELEKNARGIVALGISNNFQLGSSNYSNVFGVYTKHQTADGKFPWLAVNFTTPDTNRFTVPFESNRYYKFTVHFDYTWMSNIWNTSIDGDTGRIEVRVRDLTHRHDILYWTNYLDPDFQMGQIDTIGNNYYIRDDSRNPNVNIFNWDHASAEGNVPSSCHAVRAMTAKTSGSAILQVQFRPMIGYGGVMPPKLMDCSGGQPATGLPQQYKVGSVTYDSEALNQFFGYFSVEDCGPADKPAGMQQGVIPDYSISPMYESYENHPYHSSYPERP